jgi:pSer/pThr/pTyr-binding forkhead associated (FHA) protein
MVASLISLNGQPDIALGRDLILIGRHPECDVKLASRMVSSQHCCLSFDGDGFRVRDLASTNGTWINGKPVANGWIRQGDVLSIARNSYRLELVDAGSAASSSWRRPDGAERARPAAC